MNKNEDGSWTEVSDVNGISLNSESFDFGGGFDSDEDDGQLVPVTLKLRMTKDDPTLPASDDEIVLPMDFEFHSEVKPEAPPALKVRWSMDDAMDSPLVSGEDSTQSFFLTGENESICGDWMDASMTAEAWERLREEETAEAVALRQLYWDAHQAQGEQVNENSLKRWSMSKWTSTTWDYNESP